MNILYEDTALVVLDKPAGLTSEEGVPAALRQRWGRPDAYVGVIHRLDTGVSGLMVYARTPGAAAALTKQVTESQQAYDDYASGSNSQPGTSGLGAAMGGEFDVNRSTKIDDEAPF